MPIIESFPTPTPVPPTHARMGFVFDVTPDDLTDLKGEVWIPRLKIGATEYLLRPGVQLTENENDAGSTLTVELLNPAERTAFTTSALVDFGIGRKVAGAWDEAMFITLLDDAVVKSVEYSIVGTSQTPNDKAAITIESKAANLLNTTSETGLIIYDSNRVTIDPEHLDTFYDDEENAYTPELLGIPGLNFQHLIDEVLIDPDRCGFTTVQTDLPTDDYYVERYEVKMGERLYDGLKQFIGMYRPAIEVSGTTLWIRDTTIPHPDGFPDPKPVTLDLLVDQLTVRREPQKLDGLLVHSVGLVNNYDFTAPRIANPKYDNGTTRTETEEIYIEFHKITAPGKSKIIADPLNIRNSKTYLNGVLQSDSSEVYEFDANYEYSNLRKTSQALMPDLPAGGTASMQSTGEIRESYRYQHHPFRPQTRYRSETETIASGLITNDADNPNVFNAPAVQSAAIAIRSNNIGYGQTYTYGRLGTKRESADPLRDGQVRVRTFRTDEVNGGPPVEDEPVIRQGEIGVFGFSMKPITTPVFAEDNATRSTERMEDFSVGELPWKYAQPLARRWLIQRQTSLGTLNETHIGYDASLTKGTVISAYDRAGVAIGVFVIVGITQGDRPGGGWQMALQCREIAETAAALNSDRSAPSSYADTIEEGMVWTATIPIECATGYQLKVLQGAVSNVLIEGKESTVGGFTNLETGAIDLGTWDGLTRTFNLRFTFGAVAVKTRVAFDLDVDVA